MISLLEGIVVDRDETTIILSIAGVGYEILVTRNPMKDRYFELHNEIQLFTHLLIKDEEICLFGFMHHQERVLFKTLIKLKGIGAKVAMALLSGIGHKEFLEAVSNNDIKRLEDIDGIGVVTASRIITGFSQLAKSK